MSVNWEEAVANGAVVLTVNQRLSRHLNQRWLQWAMQQERRCWETPSIVPFSAWLNELQRNSLASGLSKKTLLSGVAQQLLWLKCLKEDPATQPLLDIEATVSHVQRSWLLLNSWQCALPSDDFASVDHLAFKRWQTRYRHYCHEQQCIDGATLITHLAELIEASSAQMDLPTHIFLTGFLQLDVQQQALIDTLVKLGIQVEELPTLQQSTSGTVFRQAHVDDQSLLRSIALQTHAALLDNPSQSLGVVVPDLQMRRASVLRSFDSVFFPSLSPDQITDIARPYDLSLGLPLAEQSVVKTALSLLQLWTGRVDDTTFSSLLLSPYLLASEAERSMRAGIDRRCREKRVRNVGLQEAINFMSASHLLKAACVELQSLRMPVKSPCAFWALQFTQALKLVGWPGSSTDTVEYQCIQAWNTCLDDLQSLDDGTPMSAKEALHLLLKLCKERLFQLDTPVTPIQIMGRLESHGIDFDQLWLAGMDADQWPPVNAPSPFIPISSQKLAGVPEAAANTRLSLAETEYALWRSRANKLHVCHAQVRDSLPLAPASVVADVPLTRVPNALVQHRSGIAIVSDSAEFEYQKDTHGHPLPSGDLAQGGARLLENQAACPFRAFALHRLMIKPLEEAAIGPDPRQQGTQLHRAMELFWEEVKTHAALSALSEQALIETCERIIDDVLKEIPLESHFAQLQARQLLRLMTEWLELCEKPRKPFVVLALEKHAPAEVGGISMEVQVDRMDKLDSGEVIILDYKTGRSNSVNSWSEQRISHPQLPLYATIDKDIEGVCFAQVVPHQYKFIGVASQHELIKNVKRMDKQFENWTEQREHWESTLSRVAEEVRQGLASITPLKKACEYCPLKGLCRIDQQLVDQQDNSDDNDTLVGATA